MPTFVPVSEEILDDRNGCNTQKNPLEINKIFSNVMIYNLSWKEEVFGQKIVNVLCTFVLCSICTGLAAFVKI